jgi:hypothetical protein
MSATRPVRVGAWERNGAWATASVRVIPGLHGRYEVHTPTGPNGCEQRFTDDLDEAKGWVEATDFGSVLDLDLGRVLRFGF